MSPHAASLVGPLFPGVPGGPELLIILLVMILLLGVPVALVVLGVAGGISLGRGDGDRIEELERRISELEAEQRQERQNRDDRKGGGKGDGKRGDDRQM